MVTLGTKLSVLCGSWGSQRQTALLSPRGRKSSRAEEQEEAEASGAGKALGPG